MANHLDSFFGAMADPTRRAVIERLVGGPAPVSELHAPHDMALPSFLKHLRKLESAGLIRSEKQGRVRMVHIEAAPLAEAEHWLARQRRLWEEQTDRLESFAKSLDVASKKD
ncbi:MULTISPECIES: ArsR/SmtB family transcription factor [Mameliella]|jgi:DNA-binding transcriptional ArsR family regulator|uniref:Regulatory protein, ArsR n=1 Tax=Mameliella alba TaxID=561184 RepID=A0A0B3S4C2_9RHOB|nr:MULTISPECIES: metalloregulator ArsR/SmtB family transcription factor [Mameliella]MCR9274242.1 metalloregulator ArsR/SmtB family transcription factor [Paracoccaceae bacterium]KHQ51536.1 Regulatory protein, ArsR [Mameliella alba]OWV41402.1 transcriptional regulator [Mameliella alba]OWV54469.1 transcriptional regulator [Mameliella alba]PTR38915.1 ArsR family transcriptional regulator [Mameliella alba]